MSAQSVQAVLSRAMSDPAFAERLFSDPDAALAGYELTAEEAGKFRAMSRVEFDKWVNASPDERKSFMSLIKHGG